MATGFTASSSNSVVTVTATATGNQTDATINYNVAGTGQTATTPSLSIVQGVTATNTQDSITLDFKGGSAPASQSIEFTSGSTLADMVSQILATSFAGIDLIQDNTFDAGNNTLAANSSRIKYTYSVAGDDTNTASGGAVVVSGDTNGTLATTGVTTVTEGADSTTTGTLTGFTISINGVSYNGTFTTNSDAASQASQLVTFLNAQS